MNLSMLIIKPSHIIPIPWMAFLAHTQDPRIAKALYDPNVCAYSSGRWSRSLRLFFKWFKVVRRVLGQPGHFARPPVAPPYRNIGEILLRQHFAIASIERGAVGIIDESIDEKFPHTAGAVHLLVYDKGGVGIRIVAVAVGFLLVCEMYHGVHDCVFGRWILELVCEDVELDESAIFCGYFLPDVLGVGDSRGILALSVVLVIVSVRLVIITFVLLTS